VLTILVHNAKLRIVHPSTFRISCVRFPSSPRMPISMDEGRKRVLLIAASILAARKLAQFEGGARVHATICAISDSIRWAEEIMSEIDRRWATKVSNRGNQK
jgi:hypothetical protein